jgi:hypothetical protein
MTNLGHQTRKGGHLPGTGELRDITQLGQDRRRTGVGDAGNAGQKVALAPQVGMAVDMLADLLLDRGDLFVQKG